MEHKDEETCDHVSHMDENETNGAANAVVSSVQLMVKAAGGTPADWAAVLALAALVARKSLETLPCHSKEALELVNSRVARAQIVVESTMEERALSPGSSEKN